MCINTTQIHRNNIQISVFFSPKIRFGKVSSEIDKNCLNEVILYVVFYKWFWCRCQLFWRWYNKFPEHFDINAWPSLGHWENSPSLVQMLRNPSKETAKYIAYSRINGQASLIINNPPFLPSWAGSKAKAKPVYPRSQIYVFYFEKW